jgi:hypothetical protein
MSKAIVANDNEKRIGIELKKTVKALEESREQAVQTMAETISLAADAGDIILSAETEGLNTQEILRVGGVSEEQARRLKRVAGARPSLTSPEPTQLRQLALWAGLLPDPIENSAPRNPKPWHSYLVAASQWVSRKRVNDWSEAQRAEFVAEAKPIVEAWVEAGGRLD